MDSRVKLRGNVQSGIEVLDRLLSDADAPPIPPDARDAVAAVQALLLGHWYQGLPTLLASSRGVFGPRESRRPR